MSDEQLVELVINGNIDAYGELVGRFKGSIFSISIKIVRNYHTAEDIVQETFIDGYLKLMSLKDYAKFQAWLIQIARNKCFNYLKRSKCLYDGEIIDGMIENRYFTPEEAVIRNAEHEVIESAFLKLSDKLRPVAIMHFCYNYTHQNIAELLKIPEGTVKSRLHEAKNKLMKELDSIMEDYRLPEDFEMKVAKKVEQLEKYRDSYNDYAKSVGEIVAMIDSHAEASGKNNLLDKIRDNVSELGTKFIGTILNNFDEDSTIKRIDEEGIPMLKKYHADNNTIGELLFWKASALLKQHKYDQSKKIYEESVAMLNKWNVYYANSRAGLRLIECLQTDGEKYSEMLAPIMCDILCCGNGFDYENNVLKFTSQPGFNDGSDICKYSSLFYYASRCNRIIIDPNMKVGESISGTSKYASATLTLLETNADTCEFTDCIKYHISYDDYEADIWYAKGIGLVRMNVTSAEEDYQLVNYSVNSGICEYMPFAVGNIWRYKNVNLLSCYDQLIENEVVEIKDDSIFLTEINVIKIKSDYETSTEVDSDLFISIADRLCHKFELEKAIYNLQIAIQLNTSAKSNAFAIAALDYVIKIKSYFDRKFRLLPGSVIGSDINIGDGRIKYGKCDSYYVSASRFGTRHAENKIFGMKPFRYLQMITGCIYDEKWTVGYSENFQGYSIKAEDGGTITTSAGIFDKCLKITIDKPLPEGANYWENYQNVDCGVKEYWFAPNIGIVKHLCIWDDFISVCELSDYTKIATKGEYMPIYLECRWVYDEKTLEPEYRARRTMKVAGGLGNHYLLVEEQEFVYLDTEENYNRIFAKN